MENHAEMEKGKRFFIDILLVVFFKVTYRYVFLLYCTYIYSRNIAVVHNKGAWVCRSTLTIEYYLNGLLKANVSKLQKSW